MGNYNEIRYDINPYLIGDDRIYGGYIVKKPIFLIHANKESPVPNFQASLQSSCKVFNILKVIELEGSRRLLHDKVTRV